MDAITKPKYDEDKLKQLILYISDSMGDSDTFGATMLNKVLFYSDFFYYAEHGKAITGAEYQRLKFGPAPKKLLPVRKALLEEKRAVMRTHTLGPREQTRIVPIVEPDLTAFSAAEIKMVDEVIGLLRDKTAVVVSDISHRMIGWMAAEDRETIPYSTVFLTKTKVSKDDRRVAEKLKKSLAA